MTAKLKGFIGSFLAICMIGLSALADPLVQDTDWTGSVFIPYDQNQAGPGYTWSWQLPHMDEADERAHLVNAFYEYFLSDSLNNAVPLMAESLAEAGIPVQVALTYQKTCNNEQFISFLFSSTETAGDQTSVIYEGHTFSLEEGMPGSTLSLPHLLGFLNSQQSTDTWLESRQTEKANQLVRSLVYARITENRGLVLNDDFSEETLEYCFFPELDFYLDENSNPVFFLQPGTVASEEAGRLDFPISLSELRDEW